VNTTLHTIAKVNIINKSDNVAKCNIVKYVFGLLVCYVNKLTVMNGDNLLFFDCSNVS